MKANLCCSLFALFFLKTLAVPEYNLRLLTDPAPAHPFKPRIVQGTVISADNYEWMVAFSGKSKSYGVDLFCGGSLIRNSDPPIALTAAHCIDGLSERLYQQTGETFSFYATLSRNNVNDDSETGYITLPWVSYKYHTYYNTDNYRNDIAVVLLGYASSVAQQEAVGLYDKSTECCSDYEYPMRVLGYGAQETDQAITGTLEYADLQYVTQVTCNKWFYLWNSLSPSQQASYDFTSVDWSTVNARATYIYPGMICAYAKTQDACQGDSGGPLIRGTSQSSPQIGVVSWGSGCADNVPGVYTSVGYYSEWIRAASGCLLQTQISSYASDCAQLTCTETTNTGCFGPTTGTTTTKAASGTTTSTSTATTTTSLASSCTTCSVKWRVSYATNSWTTVAQTVWNNALAVLKAQTKSGYSVSGSYSNTYFDFTVTTYTNSDAKTLQSYVGGSTYKSQLSSQLGSSITSGSLVITTQEITAATDAQAYNSGEDSSTDSESSDSDWWIWVVAIVVGLAIGIGAGAGLIYCKHRQNRRNNQQTYVRMVDYK